MSRTSFWTLLPFLLAFAGIMVWIDFFLGAIYTAEGCFVTVGVCIVLGFLGLAFYDSKRFWWASFFLATCLFFLYTTYIIYEWFFSGHPWTCAWALNSPVSPVKDILGAIFFGILEYVFVQKFRRDKQRNQVDLYEDRRDNEGEEWVDETEDTKWYGKP